jgi:hypothetical protein
MEVIISKTVFQEFPAIFAPDSPQEMRPEEQLPAAASLLQKKEDTIANMQFEIQSIEADVIQRSGGKICSI